MCSCELSQLIPWGGGSALAIGQAADAGRPRPAISQCTAVAVTQMQALRK